MRVRWSLEDICVVSVEAALQLDDGGAAVVEGNGVVVTVGFASGFPLADEALVLHVIENLTNEVAFVAHRGGELAAYPFDRASEEAAVVELSFSQAMVAERVSIGF